MTQSGPTTIPLVVLAPLKPRESAVDAVARVLRSAILRGELAIGSQLPPERKLAEELRVNRVTLRAALAKLTGARMLRVRHGSGYEVLDYARGSGPELLGELAGVALDRGSLPEVVADLLLVRRHLARAVLERLAGRSRRATLPIARAIASFAFLAESGAPVEDIALADMEVLAAILDATESTVLKLCFHPVLATVVGLEPLRAVLYAEPRTNAVAYRVLSAWLEERDPRHIEAVVLELQRRDTETLGLLTRSLRGGRTRATAKPTKRRAK
ncbi:MAG: FadR family transcriptional regulator [Myxococcales bacterium]|nr:FadR family transcriptional regulator [Myxococcales bacterium]